MNRSTTAAERQLRQPRKTKRQKQSQNRSRKRKAKAQSRVPVTALIAWPGFHSLRAEPQGDKQMAAPAEPRTPNLHRAKRSLFESADGSMATVATRREKNPLSQKKNKEPT